MDSANTKFCKYCGASIPTDAVVCTACGRQVEDIGGVNPPAPAAGNYKQRKYQCE